LSVREREGAMEGPTDACYLRWPMKEIISPDRAPAAIGPYSQAVRAGGFVFLSGQIPLDPATGKMIEGDIEAQTRRVMENLAAVLAAAGTSFEKVVRTTIDLTDLGDFAKVNAIYGERFPQQPPARATVQVAALPRGANVEIDLVAIA
jgi:2-iminobutanoate/2-iminopropanoate deaminase